MKKGFIIGLATGLTVAGASLVLANSQIQAILNDQIKVTLNGQIQEFKDETTNETQYPITYHDRTYLPLRTVANMVGVDVDYDASSNTAILSNEPNFHYYIKDKEYGSAVISIVYREVAPEGIGYVYYNIDTGLNKQLSNQELIEAMDVNTENLIIMVKEFIMKKYSISEEELKDYITPNTDFSATIDDDKLSPVRFFINSKGNLSFGVYNPLGAGNPPTTFYDTTLRQEFEL